MPKRKFTQFLGLILKLDSNPPGTKANRETVAALHLCIKRMDRPVPKKRQGYSLYQGQMSCVGWAS